MTVQSCEHPLNGKPVTGVCDRCKRLPRPGEVYGSHAAGWDFMNICPECWDDIFSEDGEDEPTGKCHECGDSTYDLEDFCSVGCERLYIQSMRGEGND